MSDAKAPRKAPLGVRLFVWLLPALSVLELIKQLSLVELYGRLDEWIKAYNALVQRFGFAFFGWLDWGWLEVDESEYHVLLIGAVLAGATTRVYIRYDPDSKDDSWLRKSIKSIDQTIMIVVLLVVLMALLPAPIGLWAGLGIEVAIISYWIDIRHPLKPDPYRDPVREELLSISSILLLIVIINYVAFKPR